MMWLAVLIPVFAAAIMWFGFQRKMRWWEFLAPMGVSLLLIWGAKSLTEYVQCRDIEYWTGWVDRAEYYEEWNELVTRTRTVDDGNGKSHTETYTEVEYHPPYWQVIDSNGLVVSINKNQYNFLKTKFKDNKFVNLHRICFTIRGDKYVTHWPRTEETMEVVTTTHAYQNRVQASNSILRFNPPSKNEVMTYGLFEYPNLNGYSAPSILGYADPVAERKLSILNAKMGRNKQIKVWILVFRNQPMEAAINQMNHWANGNKNEAVLNIGIDGTGKVQWGYVFSWTDKELFKANARNLIIDQTDLNLSEIVDKLYPIIEQDWKRKSFKDFEYLSVDPPFWSVFTVYLITIVVNVVLSWFLIVREKY